MALVKRSWPGNVDFADLVDATNGAMGSCDVVVFAAPNCDEHPLFELHLSLPEARGLLTALSAAIRSAGGK